MTALIVWACIICYLGIGALMHSKFALAQYNANRGRGSYSVNTPSEASGWAALQCLIWPVYFLIWNSSALINKDIELQQEVQKVRAQIEEEKRIERRKAQAELAAFDRELRNRQ